MCGYCNKIVKVEHILDKHIEKFHFIKAPNENYEDNEDMDSVDVDSGLLEENNINVMIVSGVDKKDEIIDKAVVTLDSLELDHVKNEECPQTSNADRHMEFKTR